jgi:hypothetical protein
MNQLPSAIQVIYDEFLQQLQSIGENTNMLQRADQAIGLARHAIHQLRDLVSTNEFPDDAAEIHFFKSIKPHITSRYIYYTEIKKFLLYMPLGGEERVQKHTDILLRQIEYFFDEHTEFYVYYRSGQTKRDGFYFLRREYEWQINFNIHDAYNDQSFTTNYDHTLAMLLAYTDLLDYIYNPLLHGYSGIQRSPLSQLSFTPLKIPIVAIGEMAIASWMKGYAEKTVPLHLLVREMGQRFGVTINDPHGLIRDVRQKQNPAQYLTEYCQVVNNWAKAMNRKLA